MFRDEDSQFINGMARSQLHNIYVLRRGLRTWCVLDGSRLKVFFRKTIA